jgi:phosphopantothenoylcysteine decarboxylase/phosphopantothenate--cysteine ligase
VTITGRQRKPLNIIVTAGATYEPIDPVRFISNHSTGYLGCEIARQAKKNGHRVILICAALKVAKPEGVRSIDVLTARRMKRLLEEKFSWCDCLIMTAAVCDFRVKRVSSKKIKSGRASGPQGKIGISLALERNPDILAALGRRKGRRVLAGVALETENLKRNAQEKLRRKNLDLIVATQMKTKSCPFGRAKMDALLIDRQMRVQRLPGVTKAALARILLDSVEKIVLS